MAAINTLEKTSGKASGPELTITRVFDKPRSLVYDAWTKPEHLERWQGAPQGFTVPVHEVDMRQGGKYRICLRSPEGVDHWVHGVYREVVPPERLVFTHGWLDEDGKPGKSNETLVTITFKERNGKTELHFHQTGFESVESRDGHGEGWNSQFDQFAEYVAKL